MASGDRFPTTINIEEQIHLASQIGPPIEPYELVELLYNDTQIPHSSNLQPSSQVPVEVKKAPTYKCNVCERAFKEASHFTNHKRGLKCQKSIQRKDSLKQNKAPKASMDKRRKASMVPFKPYQCHLCGARFCDKGNIQLHLQKIHQSNEQLWSEFGKPSGYACSLCDFWFTDKIQLKTHQEQHNTCVPTNFNDVTQQNGGGPTFYSGGLHEDSFMFVNPSHIPYSSSDPHTMNASIASQLSLPSGLSINQDYVSQNQYSCSFINNTPIQTSQIPVPKTTEKKLDQNVDKSSSNKWHACSECELKFIDPINLEMHIKRKHSKSHSGHGDNINSVECPTNSVVCSSSDHWKSDRKVKNKSCVCHICGNKVAAMSGMISHLKRDHGTIDLDTGHGGSSQKRKFTKTPTEAKCDQCLVMFPSIESMISHKNTESFVFCGVCDFSSCSDTQVGVHIYSLHNEQLPGSTVGKASACKDKGGGGSSSAKNNGNPCSACDFIADTGCSLVQHLECHGSPKIQCCKCSEVCSSYDLVCSHIHSSHANQIAKIKVSCDDARDMIVFLTPSLVTSAAIKHTPPAGDRVTRSTKKINISAKDIENVICSSCCVSMKVDQLNEHLILHRDGNVRNICDGFNYGSLVRETTTVEFACNECGFTRKNPEVVVSHIQKVHLSGGLIHIKKLDKNALESVISNVFTPPSIIN